MVSVGEVGGTTLLTNGISKGPEGLGRSLIQTGQCFGPHQTLIWISRDSPITRVSVEASCHHGQTTRMSWIRIGYPKPDSKFSHKIGDEESIASKFRKIKVLNL